MSPAVSVQRYVLGGCSVAWKFLINSLDLKGKTDGWWLHMLMIHPERHRQGIGRKLVKLVHEKVGEVRPD